MQEQRAIAAEEQEFAWTAQLTADFAAWLSLKSWRQGVRFCKVVAIIVPVLMLAIDIPALQDPLRRADRAWNAMAVWHVVVEAFCLSVLWMDRQAWAPRRTEALTNFVAVSVLLLSASFGIIGWFLLGDMSIYALGAVFVATVICTPTHFRRPAYAASTLLILAAVLFKIHDPAQVVNTMVNPVCVAIVALQLDRYGYERNRELFVETRRVEYERARADKVLYNVFPVSIADELKRHDKVHAVKFEHMGVMFADIVGFTSFSKSLPPDALVHVLNQLFSMFDALVDRYGLEKIKTIGDAYMVVSQRQTSDLAMLALDLLAALDGYNRSNGTRFQLRIGLHVGPAVAGVIGVKRFLYDVWGDTVNVASRMESYGEPGRIHVTSAVQDALEGSFEFEARRPIDVKGQGVMATFFLRRPHELAARPA